ncbi:MAG: hypothetical protein E4H01_00305 [Lysobacterales bacterium]|nr:MAG: hypothetical protein E4H01_00305 [Xanthomonadales bacterium]
MSEISELIEKLRSVRQSTANMCGHVEDWSEHDHLCADSAEEAIDALEAQQAVIDAARWRAHFPEKPNECNHPVHENPGLIIPCPKCGAGGESDE